MFLSIKSINKILIFNILIFFVIVGIGCDNKEPDTNKKKAVKTQDSGKGSTDGTDDNSSRSKSQSTADDDANNSSADLDVDGDNRSSKKKSKSTDLDADGDNNPSTKKSAEEDIDADRDNKSSTKKKSKDSEVTEAEVLKLHKKIKEAITEVSNTTVGSSTYKITAEDDRVFLNKIKKETKGFLEAAHSKMKRKVFLGGLKKVENIEWDEVETNLSEAKKKAKEFDIEFKKMSTGGNWKNQKRTIKESIDLLEKIMLKLNK